MLPDAAVDMIVGSKKYGLTKKDAKTLVVLDDGSRLEYYMDVVDLVLTQSSSQEQESWTVGKDAGNWSANISHFRLMFFIFAPDLVRMRQKAPFSSLRSLLHHRC